MRLMITGPQGSGKTTQAKIIAQKLELCLVKTGDLVRNKAKEESEEGQSLKKSLEEGQLSDDRLVAKLLKEELDIHHCPNGFVVDGYPRRLSQLDEFDPVFDKVFYLDISDELAIKRMLGRGREDDVPELIEERLKIFREESEKVVEFYERKGLLVRINGGEPIEQVTEEIIENIKNIKE